MFTKYLNRLKKDGVRKFIFYAFGSALLPRLKINIEDIYTLDSNSFNKEQISNNETLKCSQYEEISASIVSALEGYGGIKLLNRFKINFKNKMFCYILLDANGNLQSVAWLSKPPDHLVQAGQMTWMISEIFTLPEARGMNRQPLLLKYMIKEHYKISENKEDRFVSLVSSSNTSSQKIFIKLGFHKVGKIYNLFGKRYVCKGSTTFISIPI